MLELTDTACGSLFRSKFLEPARLNYLLPHPIHYKMAWATQRADGSGVWFWRPIPPSPHFVALGMVATSSVEQPKLTDVRCVPKGWTVPSRLNPLMLWDDSGSSGRKGSLWQVGSLGLLHASEGHELAPDDKFVDMQPTPIIAAHNFVPNPNK